MKYTEKKGVCMHHRHTHTQSSTMKCAVHSAKNSTEMKNTIIEINKRKHDANTLTKYFDTSTNFHSI